MIDKDKKINFCIELNHVTQIAVEIDLLYEMQNPNDSFGWYLPPGEVFHPTKVTCLSNNTRILPNTFMEGPVLIYENCKIGPTAYLRPGSVIHKNTRIGHSVEIHKSIINMDTIISHRAYIGHSYIGKNNLIAAGFTSSVRNMQDSPIIIRNFSNGQIVSKPNLYKLGVITGDSVWIGCNVLTMPGTFIAKETNIKPFNSLGGSKGKLICD